MTNLHAHAKIEYTDFVKTKEQLATCGKMGDSFQKESTMGFDPATSKGRKMAHTMLDEYLDYLVRLGERADPTQECVTDHNEKNILRDNGFAVFHFLDRN
jgi:hypothetical protein